MNVLVKRSIILFLKLYVVAALVVAVVSSPSALSFIPILLLAWYLYQWWRPMTPVINLLTNCFIFFATALLLSVRLGSFFSLLVALPLLVLIHFSLEETAVSLSGQPTRFARRPTTISLTLSSVAVAAILLAWLVGSLPLLLAGGVLIVYLGVLVVLVLWRLPSVPVDVAQIHLRVLAGSQAQTDLRFTSKAHIGGVFFLESPDDWVKVNPAKLLLSQGDLTVKASLTPSLAGPSVVRIVGKAIDRWGMLQVSFELDPIRLYVIPRARYAVWLARRYLAGTRPGALPLISNIEAMKSLHGLRRGIEYYGSQLYQPGDSLKNIDWKHSIKYNELITKEFAEFHGQPAVILINLAVRDAEEADKLAYNILVTALSLARENIPAGLAAYDHSDVRVTTSLLQPRQLVLESLGVAQKMVTFINPVKYLDPPDVTRLRANLSRIRLCEGQASKVLAQLMDLEYRNLSNIAKNNPATKALNEAFNKVDKQANVVVISYRNHDAEALAFNTFSFTRKGNAIIAV